MPHGEVFYQDVKRGNVKKQLFFERAGHRPGKSSAGGTLICSPGAPEAITGFRDGNPENGY
jgi:hypothetical protein